MGKRVIINVDDFGMSRPINRGIVELMEGNHISSTSLMATMPAAEEAILLAKKHKITCVGLHLDVTEGVKLLPLKPYMLMQVKYRRKPEVFKEKLRALVDPEDILEECRRQYAWALDHGLEPDHINFHHGLISNPLLRRPILEWITTLKKPIRRIFQPPGGLLDGLGIKTPDRLAMSFYGANSTKAQLLRILAQVDEGETVEIMSHAGYNGGLKKPPFFRRFTQPHREKELRVLKHPDIQHALVRHGIELIPFGDL